MESGGQTEKRSTLNLCFDRVWIDVHAAVNRADDPLDFDRAIRGHFDSGDLRCITSVCELHRNPAPMPRGEGCSPFRFFRGKRQNSKCSRIVAKQSLAISDRILLRGMRKFIYEAFDHKNIVSWSDSAPPRCPDTWWLDPDKVDVDIWEVNGAPRPPLLWYRDPVRP